MDERISMIEEHCKRLKRQIMMSYVLIIILSIVAIHLYIAKDCHGMKGTKGCFDEIETKKMVIKDESNNDRIIIDVTKKGNANIKIAKENGEPQILIGTEDSCISSGEKYVMSDGKVVEPLEVPVFSGLRIMESHGKYPSIELGFTGYEKPLSTSPGLSINRDGEGRGIILSLDSEFKTPCLMLKDVDGAYVDMGIWFMDRRPYLRLYDKKKVPRASIFLQPNGEPMFELMKGKERPKSWLP